MASIRKRIDSKGRTSYHVCVRKKVKNKVESLSATFKDEKTAILWGEFKEDLLNEMNNFELDRKETVRMKDLLQWKILECQKEDKKDGYNDFKALTSFLMDNDLYEKYINEITTDMLINITEKNKNKIVLRGGWKASGKGKQVTISPQTLKSKMTLISVLFNFARLQNIKIENSAFFVLNHFKNQKYWV